MTARVIVADRRLHDALCHGGPFDLLGRPVSAQRRKRRQPPLHSHARGRSMAQDLAGHRSLGCRAGQKLLPSSPVPSATRTPWCQKSHPRVRCLDAHCRVSHAQKGVLYQDLGPARLHDQLISSCRASYKNGEMAHLGISHLKIRRFVRMASCPRAVGLHFAPALTQACKQHNNRNSIKM